MRDNKKCVAVVLAGGKGSRMGSDIPKQYMMLAGFPVIYYSLKIFEDSFVDEVILVCGNGDEDYCKQEIVRKYGFTKVSRIVAGGSQRYHSVYNGLKAIDACDIVFIHDGARPCITQKLLADCFDDAVANGAAVAAVPSKDTVKISDSRDYAVSTPNRENVWIIQTPQTFIYEDIMKAYSELIKTEEETKNKGITITDDAMVMELFGSHRVKLTRSGYTNIKITTPEDMILAEAYLKI